MALGAPGAGSAQGQALGELGSLKPVYRRFLCVLSLRAGSRGVNMGGV